VSKQANPSKAALEKLKDTDLTFVDAGLDIRGRKVVDRNGADIGHVSALFVDDNERKISDAGKFAGAAFLEVGTRHFLLPVDAITQVFKSEVHISETKDRIEHSPVYDPALVEIPTQEHWNRFTDIMASLHTGTADTCIQFFLCIRKKSASHNHHDHDVQEELGS